MRLRFIRQPTIHQAADRQDNGAAQALTNSVGMKLAFVPAGKFTMGSPKAEVDRGDDEAEHSIQISRPYYMGVTAVTQGSTRRSWARTRAGSPARDPGGSR